jgi:hypothetical protein
LSGSNEHDALGFEALLYVVLFVTVLGRLTLRWRRTHRSNGSSLRRSMCAARSPCCA